MDENNPPLMLPNGEVFASRSIMELTTKGGKVSCPIETKRAGASAHAYPVDQLRKVFIA